MIPTKKRLYPNLSIIKKPESDFVIGFKCDGLVKSQKTSFSVIPAKAGIQCFKELMTDLDPGFRRGDDFLRVHQEPDNE
ncbi:MAG: hypothetical protein H8D67_10445 [Deltaproteobacteria bacterium]|nr:hypothetical protein [Deltaproteobacteria bacterium]